MILERIIGDPLVTDVLTGVIIGFGIPALLYVWYYRRCYVYRNINHSGRFPVLLIFLMMFGSMGITLTLISSRVDFTPKYYMTECQWKFMEDHVDIQRKHLYEVIPNSDCGENKKQ